MSIFIILLSIFIITIANIDKINANDIVRNTIGLKLHIPGILFANIYNIVANIFNKIANINIGMCWFNIGMLWFNIGTVGLTLTCFGLILALLIHRLKYFTGKLANTKTRFSEKQVFSEILWFFFTFSGLSTNYLGFSGIRVKEIHWC